MVATPLGCRRRIDAIEGYRGDSSRKGDERRQQGVQSIIDQVLLALS